MKKYTIFWVKCFDRAGQGLGQGLNLFEGWIGSKDELVQGFNSFKCWIGYKYWIGSSVELVQGF